MAAGMQVTAEGQILIRETRKSNGKDSTYNVVEVAWMGGSSGWFMVSNEEFARVPPVGSQVVLTFEAQNRGKEGIKTRRLIDVKPLKMAGAVDADQFAPPPMATDRPRARAA